MKITAQPAGHQPAKNSKLTDEFAASIYQKRRDRFKTQKAAAASCQ